MRAEVGDDGLLAQAAVLAGSTVAIVKHSGPRGTRDEFFALVKGLEAVMVEHPDNMYVQALLTPTTREQIEGFVQYYQDEPRQTDIHDFKMAALNRCGQAAEWMAANIAPEVAAEVKASILAVCRRVAEESHEGGLLSMDAAEIDLPEQNVLNEIERALQVR